MPDLDYVHVFVDECGNTDVHSYKKGGDSHYVITGLVVDAVAVSAVSCAFEKVRQKHFQTGEMKSSTVGQNHERRCRILGELTQYPFRIFSLPVDKRRLTSPGYNYQGVFYKNLNKKLYEHLFEFYPSVQVFADKYKDSEFMQEFRRYLQSRLQRVLFCSLDVVPVESKQEVIVQAADFIGGSIARHFDIRLHSPQSERFLKILSGHIDFLEPFPPAYTPFGGRSQPSAQSPLDAQIRTYAIRKASRHYQTLESNTSLQARDQRVCTAALLTHLYFKPGSFLQTERLREIINRSRDKPLSVHEFRSSVIAPLRDKGILIASSRRGGYKIIACLDDIRHFLNLINNQTPPLLARLQHYRRLLYTATRGTDILADDAYKPIRKCLPQDPLKRY